MLHFILDSWLQCVRAHISQHYVRRNGGKSAAGVTMLRSLLSLVVSLGGVASENGLNGWLRYAPLPNANNPHLALASNIIALNTSKISPVYTASLELQKGIQSIFSQIVKINDNNYKASSSLTVGTIDTYSKV